MCCATVNSGTLTQHAFKHCYMRSLSLITTRLSAVLSQAAAGSAAAYCCCCCHTASRDDSTDSPNVMNLQDPLHTHAEPSDGLAAAQPPHSRASEAFPPLNAMPSNKLSLASTAETNVQTQTKPKHKHSHWPHTQDTNLEYGHQRGSCPAIQSHPTSCVSTNALRS